MLGVRDAAALVPAQGHSGQVPEYSYVGESKVSEHWVRRGAAKHSIKQNKN